VEDRSNAGLPGVTVVGKIDLNNLGAKPAEAPKAPEPVKEVAPVAEAPKVEAPKAPEPVKEVVAPEPVAEAPKPEPVKEAVAPAPVAEHQKL
jgi:translation initiation factor IF-2